jgi:PKD repeat protein
VEGKIMKKLIVIIIILAILYVAVPVLAISDDGNQTYQPGGSQTDITTSATINGGSGGSQTPSDPIIKVKWEYDEDINLQSYDTDPTHHPSCYSHDAAPCIPNLQVAPIIGSTVTVGYYAVVTSPLGVDPNSSKLGYISTYDDVWHPDGQFKYQIQLQVVGWNGETYNKTEALSIWDHVTSFHDDLITVNENWANTLPPGTDWTSDVHDELNEGLALLYYTTAEISYCQPGGYYYVGTTAFDRFGNQAQYLYNDFWYIPTSAVEIDFTSVDYSPVQVGTHKTVCGDQDMMTPNKPTVRNIGNTPLKLNIWQDDMDFGMTSQHWNVQFDARLGAPGVNGDVMYSPYQNASGYPGVWIPGVLPLCTEDKLDFSIQVSKGSPGYTYGGLMKLYAYIDMSSYIWETPNQFVGTAPGGVPYVHLNGPLASFTHHPLTPTTSDTLQFTDTSTDNDGIIVSWSWNFGDGSTSSDRNPTHNYDYAGTYIVTLRVSDDNDYTDVISESIHVVNVLPILSAPAANFTYLPVHPTTSDTLQFTDTSTDNDGIIASWQWIFGDGNTSTLQNPTYRYTITGNYSVTLEVTDNGSATDTETKILRIYEVSPLIPPPPSPSPSSGSSGSSDVPPKAEAKGPYYGFMGTLIPFNGSASNDPDGTITSYIWNFGDGTTGTGTMIAHTYNNVGNYTVTLTVTDNDGKHNIDTTSATITERPNTQPTADFSYSPFHPTIDDTIQFTDLSTDPDGTIVSYFWNFSDGTNSTEKNPTHTFGKSGVYMITLQVTDNDGASDIVSKNILVEESNNKYISASATEMPNGIIGFEIMIIAVGVIAFVLLWRRKKVT